MRDPAPDLAVRLDPQRPFALLAQCPAYAPTPLTRHGGIWVKDETNRMGLGAFKALGGVYAVARLLQDRLQVTNLADPKARRRANALTFVCASAGNHGLAVAAGARIFGARSRVHLSRTVPESFADKLRAKGATVVRSGADYDESIAIAIRDAQQQETIHLADGSWPGYTEAPRLVMEGYTVMAEEMRAQFTRAGAWPKRVYLQAGVGGLAAAIAARIRTGWPHQPQIVVVEPSAAPCLKRSAEAGKMVRVSGPASNMGRLDCKTPSLLAFEILRRAADRYVTISDAQAQAAMSRAGAMGYATTASGAAGLAAALADEHGATDSLVVMSEAALA